MNNLFLLAGLAFFVACTEDHKNMELVSNEVEEARALAIEEEKKIINNAGTQRQNILTSLLMVSTFEDKVRHAQEYLVQLPIALNTKNRNENLKRAESLLDLTHSLELITRNRRAKSFSHFEMEIEDEKAFFAIAATLHTPNGALLKVIEESLNPETSSELYISEEASELMLDLLKARVDILSVLSLQDAKEAQLTITKTATNILSKIQNENKKIPIGLKSNLESAIETLHFLRSVGIDHKIDNKTKRQLKKITLDKQLKLNETELEKTEEILKLIEELVR